MIKTEITIRPQSVDKKGFSTLYLRIIFERKIYYINLNYKVFTAYFDIKNSAVNKKHENYTNVNLFINKQKSKADNIILKLSLNDEKFTIEKFKQYFFNDIINNNNNNNEIDFFDFALKEIEYKKAELGQGTLKQYNGEINKLKKFKEKFDLKSIDYNFLQDYEFYMRDKLNNTTNTVEKTFKKLKVFMKIAINKKLIDTNPFENYKVKHERTNRNFLTLEEISIIENYFLKCKSDKIKKVLRCFLFACYTGLRFQDVKNLKWSNIDGNKIKIIQNKTGDYVFIPLIENSSKYLPEKTDDFVFSIASDQKTNDYLKVVAMHCNIDKNISFHTARHTFATMALNLGVPLDVVSKLLGHENIKTTQIYAKLLETTKIQEMQKLEEKLRNI